MSAQIVLTPGKGWNWAWAGLWWRLKVSIVRRVARFGDKWGVKISEGGSVFVRRVVFFLNLPPGTKRTTFSIFFPFPGFRCRSNKNRRSRLRRRKYPSGEAREIKLRRVQTSW